MIPQLVKRFPIEESIRAIIAHLRAALVAPGDPAVYEVPPPDAAYPFVDVPDARIEISEIGSKEFRAFDVEVDLFVYSEQRSSKEANTIANRIAEELTNDETTPLVFLDDWIEIPGIPRFAGSAAELETIADPSGKFLRRLRITVSLGLRDVKE